MNHLKQARFVRVQALLSVEGLQALLNELGPITIARTGALLEPKALFLKEAQLIESYSAYIGDLREGVLPDMKAVRPYLSTTWSAEVEAFTLQEAKPGLFIAHLTTPAIQLRAHLLAYSSIDHSFHSVTTGKEAIPWGIEFSYASLAQRGVDIEKIPHAAPNSKLFRKLQRWMRAHTAPVVFSGKGEAAGWLKRSSARISPECRAWITQHPALGQMEVV